MAQFCFEDSIPRVYWMAYLARVREGRYHGLSFIRDGAAVPHILEAMRERGFAFGDIIPNGPPSPEELRAKRAQLEEAAATTAHACIEEIVEFGRLDPSRFLEKDVLLVPTRLPMNDLVRLDKRYHSPGFTGLERLVFQLVRRFFLVISRSYVCMSDALAATLPSGFADRASIEYFQQGGPPFYKSLAPSPFAKKRWMKREARTTAAYVLRLPAVPQLNGASVLVFWGMGGDQTLAFARRLRGDLSYLLDRDGLSMVEFTVPDEDSSQFDFAASWSARVILEGAWPDSIPRPSF